MLYQELIKHKDILQKQIQQLKQQLTQYPEGHLICIKNGKYTKNVHVQNSIKTYIPKKNMKFAKKLAAKKYLTASLNDLLKEQNAINAFLKHYQNYTSQTEQLISNPSYQKLISASFTPASNELAEWAAESYEKNPSHQEHLRHFCLSGHLVRSKSEVLIDQSLFTHQIPFRYECALKLGDLIFYPDFTIRHPENGQLFYWEHFGLMDSPAYSQNAFQKLQIYNSHGYVPTINLITTFETKRNPLTIKTIEAVIQQYFL